MFSLQKTLRSQIAKIPEMALRVVVERKLTEANIALPNNAIDALVKHLIDGRAKNFIWEDAYSPNPDVNITFGDSELTEIKAVIAKIIAALPRIVEDWISKTGDRHAKLLREHWLAGDAAQIYEITGFRERLEERWGEGLSLLRLLLTRCRGLGRDAYRRFRRSKSRKHMNRRFVLTRLHARACQTTDEIVTLMENGFADGAMARWRTLHELVVVATLIADGDEDLAERYINHDAVDVKRQADDYVKTLIPLGYAAISVQARRDIDKKYGIRPGRAAFR